MTNVLAGAYPDVIKAGSVYSGVPDGCFYVAGTVPGQATPGWNSQCADGQLIESASQWGDLARSYYPSYTGSRPKMLMYVVCFVLMILISEISLKPLIAGMAQLTPLSTTRTWHRRYCSGPTCWT
jgi:hypothetical protein